MAYRLHAHENSIGASSGRPPGEEVRERRYSSEVFFWDALDAAVEETTVSAIARAERANIRAAPEKSEFFIY